MKLFSAVLPLLVYAASSERPVLEALKPQLELAAGEAVELKFGDAELLAKEIDTGAAADIFVADDGTVERLALDEKIEQPVVRCATASLAIVAARGADFTLPKRFDGATAPAFARLPFRTLAMLPAKSPAGRAAAEALHATQIFDDVKGRFLPAAAPDDALEALAAGKAEVAIVPASLARALGLPSSGIEPELHGPLRESAGVVMSSRKKDAARRLLKSVLSLEAADVWKRFGFRAP
jgi:molybdate transport system substrate-binding protein